MVEWEIKRLERESKIRSDAKGSRTFRLQMFALVLAVTGFAAFGFAFAPEAPRVPSTSIEVRVQSGDTLWELAERFPIQGMRTEELIQLIARINGIEGGMVRAGAVVEVPHDTSFQVASQ